MPDFADMDLNGAQFREVDLREAVFERANLRDAEFRSSYLIGARFAAVDLTGAVMRGVDLVDVDISGQIENLTINGVDVAPLITAELDRRYPERAAMRPTTPEGFRAAWDIVERLWAGTVDRARQFDPALLHESVGGEWSFTETLRHLVFATDAWIRRAVLGDPSPWTPSTCRSTRCATPRECRGIGRPGRRWTTSLPCAATGWPRCARWSTA